MITKESSACQCGHLDVVHLHGYFAGRDQIEVLADVALPAQ